MKLWYAFLFLYFISPFDFLPDYIGPYGYIDDLVLILYYILFKRKLLKIFLYKLSQRNFNHKQSKEDHYQHHQNLGSDEKEIDPWEILQVDQNASATQIKDAYRKRCKEYHPDKVNNLGIKLKEKADEEFKKIQQAWHMLN